MNKAPHYIISAALAALMLAACGNSADTPDADEVGGHPNFSATIGADLTRAFDRSWEKDDKIGISGGGRSNVCHITVAGNGNFSVNEVTEQIYFQGDNEVTFTAYYPWQALAEGNSTITADTKDQSKQKSFDFLWAKAAGKKAAPNVTFSFSHMMSKLTFSFKNGDGMDGVNIASYEISGLTMKGSFNIASGVCQAGNDAAESLKVDVVADAAGSTNNVKQPSLILFPQSLAGKSVSLKITDTAAQDYRCNLSFTDNKIAAGNNYQYTITVNKTGLIIDNQNIMDWTVKNEENNAFSE